MNKSILSLVIALLFISYSCNEDDATGFSSIVPTIDPVISFPTAIMLEEKDTTITVTLTLSEEQVVDVKIDISVDEASTATVDSDYGAIGDDNALTATISAFTRTASFDVPIFFDADIEGDETLLINVGEINTANAVFEARQLAITLFNSESPTIDIEVDWNVPFPIYGDGTMLNTCEINPAFIPDLDPTAYIFHAAPPFDYGQFFSYSDDYGACPELFSNVGNEGGWPDNTYLFSSFLFANPLMGFPDETTDWTTTVTVTRPGAILPMDFVQREDLSWTSDDPGLVEGGTDIERLLFVLEVDNGVYSFFDPVNMDPLVVARMQQQIKDHSPHTSQIEKLQSYVTPPALDSDLSQLTHWD